MGKILYTALLGAVGAVLVHIITLFLIPHFAQNDAWARLPKAGDDGLFTVISPNDPIAVSVATFDPNFVFGSCRIDLRNGPVGFTGGSSPGFWSLSVYNRQGANVFSINDRTMQGNNLDVVIATPQQLIELQKDLPAELANSVFAEADVGEGFVLLRAFVAEESLRAQSVDFIRSTACEAL